MMEDAGVVVEAEKERADRLGAALLGAHVPAKAGDDAVGGTHVLDLLHRPLARLVGRVERLGDDAVEAGALELAQPRRGDVAVVRHRRQVERRPRRAEKLLERGAPARLGLVDAALSGRGEQVEGHERRRRRERELGDARRRRVKALLQRVEVEASGADDDDLAIDDRAVGKERDQRAAQLGKVAVERAQVAALDRNLARPRPKDDGTKAVPLGLELVAAARRQRVDGLGQHRLDRRRHRCRGGRRFRGRLCHGRGWRSSGGHVIQL